MYIEMTFNEWEEKFKPTTEDGEYYDTCDDSTSPFNVWTVISFGSDEFLRNGFHYANRLGYYITEIAWEKGDEYHVTIPPNTYMEE